MDGPALSGRERRLLEEIESDLRHDARLERQLRTMGAKRQHKLWNAIRRIPPAAVMMVTAMTAICLSVGARTPTAPVITAVTVVWTVTVALSIGVTVVLRRKRGQGPVEAPRESWSPEERRARRPWDDRDGRSGPPELT
ncbi:DUF3040 domain-containing protein [Kitasatospora sp. NPDC004240]